jgi:predicted RNA binding protein YcfA (HicA-like mRNA interferase family)
MNAGERHVSRCQATSGDDEDVLREHEAAGSNPAIPTSSEYMSILVKIVFGAAMGVKCHRVDSHGRRGLMPAVPSVRGERIVRALERAGFKVVRVVGSHHIMRHPDGGVALVCRFIPAATSPREPLRGVLADADMTVQELQRLL